MDHWLVVVGSRTDIDSLWCLFTGELTKKHPDLCLCSCVCVV